MHVQEREREIALERKRGVRAGHGACIHGTGLCSCDVGYSGESCDVCAPSHFLKDGFCVTPLLSPRRQQTSNRRISSLVIVISVSAVLTIAFVLALTCHAMHCGHGLRLFLRCCLCCCCKRSRKAGGHGVSSLRGPKGCNSSSSGVGDDLTEAVLRFSDRAATDSAPGSPTCFLIDQSGPVQDEKESESCLRREHLAHRVQNDAAAQHRHLSLIHI